MMEKTETISLSPGKWHTLPVISAQEIGLYLGDENQKVLLPRKQVPEGIGVGDSLDVFIYFDSSDRLIATVRTPLLTLGEVAPLKVKQITGIGAFLDWGLEKDLLLPFREQTEKPKEGFFYPVALYVDRSGRLAATMWIDRFIQGSDPDEKKKKKALLRLQTDAENVYARIQKMGGCLDYNDKADPQRILEDFGLSKNAFKKAVGVLYKARRLSIAENKIELT